MNEDKKTGGNQVIDDAYAAFAKEYYEKGIKLDIRTVAAVIAGAILVGFNIKVFLNQGNLLSAGFSGIALLIQRIIYKYLNIQIPFWPISVALNIFPAILSYKHVGKKFTIYSCLAVAILSFTTDLFPSIKLTDDRLLIAVFGGIINGFANSIILRNGASVGGSDFLTMYFSVKQGKSVFSYTFLINAVLIAVLGILFGIDAALYTIIYQFVSTQMINMLYIRYKKKTLVVITEHPKEVSECIMGCTHHACTIAKAEGAYSGSEKYIIYAVVGALEVEMVRVKIKLTDEKAFINTLTSESISGNFYLRPIR